MQRQEFLDFENMFEFILNFGYAWDFNLAGYCHMIGCRVRNMLSCSDNLFTLYIIYSSFYG